MYTRIKARRNYLGSDPMLAPVTVSIPDPVVPDWSDNSDAGVSVDDSGMSVVTVVGHKTATPPWWALLALAAGAYYVWGRK